MKTRTLAIIKPDAVASGHTGKIIGRITNEGFTILSSKQMEMSLAQAEGFYEIHRGKPFYEELTHFMSSGPCVVLALEKEDAVNEWRCVIGATNPEKADEGTIRKLYAKNLGQNAVHGSDSDENGKKEVSYFFGECELIKN